MDEGEESSGELVIAGGDSAKELKFLKETLHQMALLVLAPVARPRVLDVGFGRDAVLCAMFGNHGAELAGAISFVRHHE